MVIFLLFRIFEYIIKSVIRLDLPYVAFLDTVSYPLEYLAK